MMCADFIYDQRNSKMCDLYFIQLLVRTNLMKYDCSSYFISATVSEGGEFELENSKYLSSWCVFLNVRRTRGTVCNNCTVKKMNSMESF